MIDGSLCQLTREGVRAAAHAPLATAVVEFCRGPRCYYVREHPHGLLPGIPNLYCLDRELRLQWLAEWPLTDDPCAAIAEVADDVLTVVSKQGVQVRIDALTGRLLTHLRGNSATDWPKINAIAPKTRLRLPSLRSPSVVCHVPADTSGHPRVITTSEASFVQTFAVPARSHPIVSPAFGSAGVLAKSARLDSRRRQMPLPTQRTEVSFPLASEPQHEHRIQCVAL